MKSSHLIITNRSPASADGWIHIVPKGELPNRTAGLVQVLDEKSLDSILANIESDKQRLGNKWPGIYAGREHFIYNDDQDSAALAWFKDFEKRNDGIWAKEDGLTPNGQTALANKEYKFTSFVADRNDTERMGGNKVRILKIETVGFTNQANGKELLTPITNRDGDPAQCPDCEVALDKNKTCPECGKKSVGVLSGAATSSKTNNIKNKMKNIAVELGLDANTDEGGILAVVRQFKNRGDISVADLSTLRNREKTLAEENQTLLGEQVEALMDAHGIKPTDKVRNRLKPVLIALKNREERVGTLVDFGHKPVEAAKDGKGTRVLNRADSKDPEVEVEGQDNEAELATKAGNEIETYKLANRCSYEDARNAIRRSKPELFGLKKN